MLPICPPDALRAIRVRPAEPHELGRWHYLLARHHYLGAPVLVGKSLLHVATLGDQWVALLGWASPALKCAARDQWIGWLPVLQWQRLHFVANNTRFLILPEFHRPNLASRVLGLSLQRLAADWLHLHGQPLLLAETFVDPSRFAGTSYKAAGWLEVGQTKGFAKNDMQYHHHGQPKRVFVKPLLPQARQWLSALVPDPQWRCPVTTLTLNAPHMESLRDALAHLPEFRQAEGLRHPLRAVLLIAICAILGGARSFLAIGQWLASLADSNDEVAIDGKTLRGAKQNDGKAVHLLSAFLQRQGVVLAQVRVETKSNEIPAIEPLLKNLNLAGRLVTADALHTQKNRRLPGRAEAG